MNGRRILVIDDDPLKRKLLRALLTLGKYEVVECPDAESGIRHAGESVPDCILMDLKLPGIDGLAATRLIKADSRLKDIPVVAVTSSAMKGDEQKALDAGCDGYITKPIDTRTFLGNIRQFLQRTQQAVRDDLRGGRPRVLVADGEPSILLTFHGMLSRENYTVIEADSGEKALAKAASEYPDIILLDLKLPDLDGYELTRRLKANLGTLAIPVILIAGLADNEDRIRGLEAGADELLTKPVDPVELLVRMKSMISLKRFQEDIWQRTRDVESLGAGDAPVMPARPAVRPAVVLVAEQDDAAAGSICAALQQPGNVIMRTRSREETLSIVSQHPVDVLVVSGLRSDGDAFELSRLLKAEEETRNLQIICASQSMELSHRLSALESGVDDCLAVPLDMRELTIRVRQHLTRKARLDDLQARYRAAMSAASSDGLTGLLNNAAFKRLIDLELKRAWRHTLPSTLLLIDVDDFKKRNDTLGHLTGDLLLKELGQILRAGVREIDLVARYGGEEFAVLLPDTDDHGGRVVGERLRKEVASHAFLAGSSSQESLTVSLGMACFPTEAATPEELIERADARLYAAKRAGKDRLCAPSERGGLAGP